MTDVGDIFDYGFFGDIVDIPKEGIELHEKQECLKSVIDKGKGHLLGKWTHERQAMKPLTKSMLNTGCVN